MIKKEEWNTLEKLSKLRFTEKEAEQLRKEMESILLFADQIKGAERKTEIRSETQFELREDEENPSFPRDAILENAPATEKGFFKLSRRGES